MYLQRQLTYDFGFLVFITLGLTLIQVWGGKSEQLEWKSGILELIPWSSLYPMDSHGVIVYSFLLVSCIPYPSHYSHGLFHDIPMWSPCESTSSLSLPTNGRQGTKVSDWASPSEVTMVFQNTKVVWWLGFFWGGILGHFHIIHRIWMDSRYFCWGF